MQRLTSLAGLGFCAALLCCGPSWAYELPDFRVPVPIHHVADAQFGPATPYAMSYSDEAAQSLGIGPGGAELFDGGASHNAYIPDIDAGPGGGGFLVKFEWHPGQ